MRKFFVTFDGLMSGGKTYLINQLYSRYPNSVIIPEIKASIAAEEDDTLDFYQLNDSLKFQDGLNSFSSLVLFDRSSVSTNIFSIAKSEISDRKTIKKILTNGIQFPHIPILCVYLRISPSDSLDASNMAGKKLKGLWSSKRFLNNMSRAYDHAYDILPSIQPNISTCVVESCYYKDEHNAVFGKISTEIDKFVSS